MNDSKSFLQVVYDSEREVDEMTDKGFCYASVEFEDGSLYPIYVTDPEFLRKDIEADMQWNGAVSGIVSLVVVSQVTREAIDQAVQKLVKRGHFEGLRPMKSWSDKGRPVYDDD